ncbi:hypothetical protein [Stratiformator vulcanicus]|uniref:Uncharacterized protein n=1 Tax=Stratiformator vulcanicus TaxID=2527980 RepID=A0A517QY21_9PLAN|nr:hypothetical protein [Stratiformator vulcanicus]QDT36488.1 hypothetical protein Pan189_08450 [Stratiformator vulcanicus]
MIEDHLSDDESRQWFGGVVATMQIIAGGLMAGVISFAAIAFVVAGGEKANDDAQAAEDGVPVLTIVGAGFAILLAISAAVVTAQIKKPVTTESSQTPPQTVPENIVQALFLYQSRMIIWFAMLEGGAFFNLIAYIVEGQWVSYVVVAVLLMTMAATFPSRAAVATWVRQRLELEATNDDGFPSFN